MPVIYTEKKKEKKKKEGLEKKERKKKKKKTEKLLYLYNIDVHISLINTLGYAQS